MKIKRDRIYTGLDIGSSKISAVVASVNKDGKFSVIAQSTGESKGISRGVIVDLDQSVRSVTSVLNNLKDSSSSGLGQIYVNISGETVAGSSSNGMIPISIRGREINLRDIAKCVEAASTIHLPFDREIVHRIVQRFSVDGQPPITDPLGLFASRLSCEVYIITAGVNSIQNIYKCVNNSGYDVKEVVYAGVADGEIMLDKNEKDEGVMLFNVGAALTEISIFSKGALRDIEITQTGAQDFRNDYKTSTSFNDLLSKVSTRIEDFRNTGASLESMVVTGGIVFNDGILEYLEEKLLCPVRMGVAKDMRGEISGTDNVKLYTAIGLAKYGSSKDTAHGLAVKNFTNKITSAVTDIFNNYF